MYLKSLEVENFKSFKGEATIPFVRGFTAITGPNGSGKSNCGDAIQFVLGPRSTKVLRAQNAKDLIFNGGKSNHPARECKVTLVFANPMLANGRRRLPVDNDEVRMSRHVRLTKSNNIVTTYFLDGNESSQKSFHRILGQANARPDGYNIVLQGDVTRLSKMTTVERRKVLDGVAGVTSYDDEIRKADRQKDQVEEYIERISLLEDEQKVRLQSLKKEKEQALKVKSLKEEHDEARVRYYQSRHGSLDAEIRYQIDERVRYESEAGALSQEVKEGERILLSLDDRIGELEKQIKQVMGDERGGLMDVIRRLQLECDRNRDRIRSADEFNVEGMAEVENIEAEIAEVSESLAGHVEALASAKLDLEKSKTTFEAAEATEKDVRTTLEHTDKATIGLSRDLSKATEALEAAREAVAHAQLEADRIETQMELISEQVAASEELLEDARLQIDDLELLGEDLGDVDPDKDRSKLAEDLLNSQREESKLRTEFEAVERRLRETERKLVSVRTELESRSGTNGMSGGAASVIAARDRGELRGIIGTIAELCAPKEDEHAEALATAVGGGMSSLVVEDDRIAAEAMAHLRSKKSGRATFLPLNKMQANRASGKAAMLVNKPGVVGFAYELLDFDPRIEAAVRYALRNTLVVEDLATARRLMGGVRLVTLRGEVTEPGGAMIGGSRARMKVGFGGRIQGASEVDKLAAEVERLSLMSDTVRAALSESMTRQQEVRNRITALSSDDHSIKLREWRSEMAMGKKAFEQARGVVIAHEKRLEELGKENNNKSSALTAAKQIHSTSEAARDSALDKLQQSSPEHLRQRLHEAQQQRVEAEGMRAKAIIILESGEDKSRLLQDMVDRLTGKADDIQSSIAARVASIKTWTASIETDGKELTERESERAVIMEEHEGLEDERMRSTEERAGLRASYSQKANDAQNRRRLAEEITRSVANKQNELIELATEMAEMAIAIADPEVELPSVGDAEKRLRALERRLEAYGPVNMLAIEQYGECEERLSSMKDDFKTLQQRRKQLITITDKLEGQRKSRLLAVLKEVNKNFKKVYNQLSDGGRGELFLEDPENPFKGGLDMWAQPRGKSSKSRLQGLSGGEQSMAALALIFAIQDHDPSPFYYFDEVDQNLDAYNAGLIAKMCRERSEAAQFIMVTLRKVSLRLADHHIGITHGGDGCSRRIVDFDRERAITLGEAALKEAKEAADVNHSRIEEASNQAKDMPKVPEALAAPSSLGNLLNHIAQEVVADESEAAVDTNFSSIVERTEDLTEDITERREIVEALLEAASEEEEITSADEEQIGIEEEV